MAKTFSDMLSPQQVHEMQQAVAGKQTCRTDVTMPPPDAPAGSVTIVCSGGAAVPLTDVLNDVRKATNVYKEAVPPAVRFYSETAPGRWDKMDVETDKLKETERAIGSDADRVYVSFGAAGKAPVATGATGQKHVTVTTGQLRDAPVDDIAGGVKQEFEKDKQAGHDMTFGSPPSPPTKGRGR